MDKIIVLCGKSASGKDALLKELVKHHGFKPIVSATSRPMRDGEEDHIDYHFKTRDEFLNMIADDELIEYRTYDTFVNGNPDTWYYGVPKSSIKSNTKHAAVLELKGLAKFKNIFKDRVIAVMILVKDDVRKQRAMNRGSFDEHEWNRRLLADKTDFDLQLEGVEDLIDYSFDNNGDKSIEELAKLIVQTIGE